MGKIIKNRRGRYTFTIKKEIVNEFKKQSFDLNKSMSERVEEMMIRENKKGEK